MTNMQSGKQNRIISVCAGLKGSGKTWLTAALAQALGIKGYKVLFFDADGGAENIAYQFGLKHTDTFSKMLKGYISLNNASVFLSKNKFELIYANPHEKMMSSYPVGRAQILALDMQNLAAKYDGIMIDCLSDNTTLKNTLVSISTDVILLVTPSASGLAKAYAELETIERIAPYSNIFVVVNHALSVSQGEHTFQTLLEASQKFMQRKIELLGVLCQDGRIRDCVLNKTTLFERYPVCESLEAVTLMAANLMKGEK